MGNKTPKIVCTLQGRESEQLILVRRWLDELEGSNRRKAFELMNQVMDNKITNKEAFALLGISSFTSVNSDYI
jgi:hypothetical protein